jgi:hypothetical protein
VFVGRSLLFLSHRFHFFLSSSSSEEIREEQCDLTPHPPMSFRRPLSVVPPTSSSSHTSRSTSPSPPPASPGWTDPYAPRPTGLPLYIRTTSGNSSQDPQQMEVIDSSTARRRGAGPLDAPLGVNGNDSQSDRDDDRKDKAEQAWPTSGIGMEGRIPETRSEFLSKGGAGGEGKVNKWEKKIRDPREPVAWVRSPLSSSFFSSLGQCERCFPGVESLQSLDCSLGFFSP